RVTISSLNWMLATTTAATSCSLMHPRRGRGGDGARTSNLDPNRVNTVPVNRHHAATPRSHWHARNAADVVSPLSMSSPNRSPRLRPGAAAARVLQMSDEGWIRPQSMRTWIIRRYERKQNWARLAILSVRAVTVKSLLLRAKPPSAQYTR